jgi:hypothetical protein
LSQQQIPRTRNQPVHQRHDRRRNVKRAATRARDYGGTGHQIGYSSECASDDKEAAAQGVIAFSLLAREQAEL